MSKVIVVGAGIVGLTTAYQLVKAGHTVTVVERHAKVAQETSFANAGQLSYAFVNPFAAPGVWRRLPVWLTQRDGPLKLGNLFNYELIRWMTSFLKACNPREYNYSTTQLLDLAMASRDEWSRFILNEVPEFSHSTFGKLILHRRVQSLATADQLTAQVQRYGYVQRRISAEECVHIEPALSGIAHQLAGGIFTPGEEAGDCQLVCEALRDAVVKISTSSSFRFSSPVIRVLTANGRVTGLETPSGLLQADAYVLANGMGARALALPLGLHLPIFPLKGYSLTYETSHDSVSSSDLPFVSITDYDKKVAYARLDSRIRVAGMADLVGYSLAPSQARIDSLKRLAAETFPVLGRMSALPWAGLRPSTPTSRPLIGRTNFDNLWINAGHGGLGFTLSMGAACGLLGLIEQRATAVDMRAFAVQ